MKKIVLLLLNISFIFLVSCSKDNDPGQEVPPPLTPPEEVTAISLENTSLEIGIGQRVVILPTFNTEEAQKLTYSWSAANDNVSILSEKEDESVSLLGMKEGETVLTIESSDKKYSVSCTVKVAKKTIKILAIGNSFSQDAVETYLYELAAAEGITLIVGNMYIGGCSLETHLTNIETSATAYSYRKIGTDGKKVSKENTSIQTALADEDWNYISVQQASPESGLYYTYDNHLPQITKYLRNAKPNSTLLMHQTWAYAKNSNHSGFANYNRDQMTMYNYIVNAVWKAADLVDIDLIIPAGTAVQNGRTSILGDSFCRDGYHLEVTYGRYTAACTWFEQIFNRSVVGNTYVPASVSEYNAKIAQNGAHYAVLKPKQVTDMVDFKEEEPEKENNKVLEHPIFIDFGSATSASPWNNVTSVSSTSRIQLNDKQGNNTGINIKISDPFGGVNTNGETSTTTSWDMPDSATRDSFWGNTGNTFEGKNIKTGSFIVSSLNKKENYSFTFFSSRSGVSDNRETQFTVTGKTKSGTVCLNSTANKSETVSVENIDPTDEGRITISVTSGPNNNNSNGFFYINAMIITPAQ